MRRTLIRLVVVAGIVAALLTWFYPVHEQLPTAIRAPTSLLLTPVAIASGLVYFLGIRFAVYDSFAAVFIANWIGWLVLFVVVRVIRGRWPWKSGSA